MSVDIAFIDWLTILFQFGNTLSTITIFGGRAIYTLFMHHSFIQSSSIYICTYIQLKTYKIYKIPLKLCLDVS